MIRQMLKFAGCCAGLCTGLSAGPLAGCSDAGASPAGDAPSSTAPAGPAVETTSTTTFAVEGMVCESCEQAIHDAVTQLPGVKSCTASHRQKSATVVFDPKQVSVDQLRKTVAKLGYQLP